jgi:hypothetical protein
MGRRFVWRLVGLRVLKGKREGGGLGWWAGGAGGGVYPDSDGGVMTDAGWWYIIYPALLGHGGGL